MALHSARPVPEVLEAIIFNVQDIIRSEVRLAKTEIEEDAAIAARAAIALGVGVVLTCWAIGLALLAAVFALAEAVDPWMASLIVSVAVAVVGVAFLSLGAGRFKRTGFGPEKTMESVKETVQWVKDQTR
jgi:hypothetical protein